MLRAHLFIEGRVQGVFFRREVAEHARELGVVGWVRNLPDGRVEALFEGADEKVEALIEWCHRGPSGAVVRKVFVRRESADRPDHQSFSVRY